MIELRPIRDNERVAIAIPTRDRHSYLSVLLASLAIQTYTNWMMVINDDSENPVEDHDTIRDLFALMRKNGNEVTVIHGRSGSARHQKAMDAVPASIDVIVRIDDDLMATPTFLQDILQPFHFFRDDSPAAVGGCYPEPHMHPISLEISVTDRAWIPRFDEPTWRLQGHYYEERQIVAVESLLGHAICYRRSAVRDVGGWAVEGYSPHAHREESDLCARLACAGYPLLVTTQALAWHLYAPGGGSRRVNKTPEGNFLVSDKRPLEDDDRIFQERLRQFAAVYGRPRRPLGRFRIADLEQHRHRRRPLITLKNRSLGAIERRFLRRARKLLWGSDSRPRSG